jgi:hypothetical protein
VTPSLPTYLNISKKHKLYKTPNLAKIKSCDLLQPIHFEGTQQLEEINERDAKPIMDVCVISYTYKHCAHII